MHIVGKVPWKTRSDGTLLNKPLMQCAHSSCHMIHPQPCVSKHTEKTLLTCALSRRELAVHSARSTYVQDDVVHAELRLLLQASQRLRVLVAQVAVQSEPGAEAGAVVQSCEEEHVAPALVAPAVVGCGSTHGESLFNRSKGRAETSPVKLHRP